MKAFPQIQRAAFDWNKNLSPAVFQTQAKKTRDRNVTQKSQKSGRSLASKLLYSPQTLKFYDSKSKRRENT